MLSAAAAHAHPGVELIQTGARAGDLVHFTISGTKTQVTYNLEVGDEDVLEGAIGIGDPAPGSFTMPDLGNAVRTVKVEAEIWESGKRKKVKRKLDYLGPALAVTDRPSPTPAPAAPVVVPQAPAAPAAISSPRAIEGPSSAPAVTAGSPLRPRQSHKARASEARRHITRSGKHHARARHARDGRKRGAATKREHRKRQRPRTAPLFDGVPEPGAETPAGEAGFLGLNAIAPRNVAARVSGAHLRDGGVDAAIVVPTLLGLVALMLAATALVRSRRLASRRN